VPTEKVPEAHYKVATESKAFNIERMDPRKARVYLEPRPPCVSAKPDTNLPCLK